VTVVAAVDTDRGPATCGRGLAEQSALPAKLGQLTDSIAQVLEVHMTALDIADPQAEPERQAYAALARAYRDIATRLAAVAEQMAGHRDLAMGRHDGQILAGTQARSAFADHVEIKRQLLEQLQASAGVDRQLLDAMRNA